MHSAYQLLDSPALGRKVHLELTVKVTADWTRSPDALKRFGYEVEGRRRRA